MADRPLRDVATSELRLELVLRSGPAYECAGCHAYSNSPDRFDRCRHCGRKGYLSGSFLLDVTSPQYRAWESAQVACFRSPEQPTHPTATRDAGGGEAR